MEVIMKKKETFYNRAEKAFKRCMDQVDNAFERNDTVEAVRLSHRATRIRQIQMAHK